MFPPPKLKPHQTNPHPYATPQKGSGGRDARILTYDLRMAQPRVRTLLGHTQEVCGLKWSPDGTTLASGACVGGLREDAGCYVFLFFAFFVFL